jgi:gamma-glutamylcyclotransferase (GGCT)/AIG2-like uncharacterized protein YtfP
MSNPEPTPGRLPKKGTGAPWGPVYGEILTFDLPAPRLRQAGDPESRLPAIDRLEGFHPLSACGHAQAGGGPCLYRRVLVPIRVNRGVLPAWLYVVENRWTGGCKEISGGVWR